MAQTLRPYQDRALEQLSRGYAAGHQRQVLVLPTGGGKTTVACKAIERALARYSGPNAILFQAHRTELIDQCSARLDENGLSAHGVIQSTHPRRRPYAPIQVGSVDTLANRAPLEPAPRLIIADECHRTIGARQNRIIRTLYPLAHVLGLTATPWRLDRKGLGQYDEHGIAQLFSAMVIGATYEQLIADDFIFDPEVYCPWRPDLGTVEITQDGEFDRDQVAEIMDRPQTNGDIVARWLEYAAGARTVCFASSVQHSRHLAEAFQRVGVRAEHLDGETDEDERRDILARLASGETQVVCNFGVLTEGWDCPACEVCILARPTTSLALYMQMVGRVLRTATGAGKVRALVLDHAGSVLRHGWPTQDRPWTLQDRPKRPRRAGAAEPEEPLSTIVYCPRCQYAQLADRLIDPCPSCGYALPVARVKAPDEQESGVPLVHVTREEVEQYAGAPAPTSWGRRAFSGPPGRRPSAFSPGRVSVGAWRGGSR